jgi:multidrug efflux pump subunit AcrA (membrane-fusion protein)
MLLSWERCPAAPRARRLVEVNVREGDAVEANDVMARVDTTT